jgi:hypothetical protein
MEQIRLLGREKGRSLSMAATERPNNLSRCWPDLRKEEMKLLIEIWLENQGTFRRYIYNDGL